MQLSPLKLRDSLIVVAVVTFGGPVAAIAQNGGASAASQLGGADSLTHQVAGLRIERSNIVTAFSGALTQFVGDCPGREWIGSATQDNVRFISYAVPPNPDLRVELVNLTSGKSLRKKYTKEGYGSSDFRVLQLGQTSGRQDIEYTIYNKVTDAVLETGNFGYDLTTTTRSYRRDGEWRSELFCATDNRDSIKDCEEIGGRQRLYCEGRKTETVRGESLSHRRLPQLELQKRPQL